VKLKLDRNRFLPEPINLYRPAGSKTLVEKSLRRFSGGESLLAFVCTALKGSFRAGMRTSFRTTDPQLKSQPIIKEYKSTYR
jgi:hypothetical protein